MERVRVQGGWATEGPHLPLTGSQTILPRPPRMVPGPPGPFLQYPKSSPLSAGPGGPGWGDHLILPSIVPHPHLPEPARKAGLSCPLVAAMCQQFRERLGFPKPRTGFYIVTQGDHDNCSFCDPGTPRGQESWVHVSALHKLLKRARVLGWVPPSPRAVPLCLREPMACKTHLCPQRPEHAPTPSPRA